MNRLTLFPVSLLALLLLVMPATAQDTDEAVAAAGTWLALVDSQQYEASWNESSAMLKQQVTQEQWQEAIAGVQVQLEAFAGAPVDLSQRNLILAERLEDMPQLPEGEYVMVRYRTTQDVHNFAEVVTMRQDDDAWRVVGYFVAPEEEE